MLSLACSVCCFPHGFQMLPWTALTQSGCDSCRQAVQHWMHNYCSQCWGMVCNLSVVLYTCFAVRTKMCGWPGDVSFPAGWGRVAWLVYMCVRERLTRKGGWVGPMEHHQEVSPVGCFVASWKAHIHGSVIGIRYSWFSVCGVCECTSGRTNNSIVREIWHKVERASESLKRSRKREREPPWVGCWCHSQKNEAKMRRKWGANNSPLFFLSLLCFLDLSLFH